MIGKTPAIIILAGFAIIMAFLGKAIALPIIGSLTTLALILVVLDFMNLLQFLGPEISGRAPKNQLVIVGVVLFLISGGAFGAAIAGSGPSDGGISTLTSYTSSSDDTVVPFTTGTGITQSAEFEIWPKNGAGADYAGSGDVYTVDPTGDAYDYMQTVIEGGSAAALTFNGGSAPGDGTVSSGEFSIPMLTAKVGDCFDLFGYQDTTPAAAESKYWSKGICLNGVNDNNQRWLWSFIDGTSQYGWNEIATLDFSDGTGTIKDLYTDNQTSTQPNQEVVFYFYPANNGEEVLDGGMYFEATTANAANFKSLTITGPNGESITADSIVNADILSSSDPRYIAAPSKSGSGTTMYFATDFPTVDTTKGDYKRTSTSDKAKFSITYTYSHAASGNALYYFHGVQFLNAKTTTGGAVDFVDDFVVNASTNAGTTGFS